jgi:hypothetical protein
VQWRHSLADCTGDGTEGSQWPVCVFPGLSATRRYRSDFDVPLGALPLSGAPALRARVMGRFRPGHPSPDPALPLGLPHLVRGVWGGLKTASGAMSAGKLESFLQRVPRWAWLAVMAVSLVALVLLTRNFFVPVYLGVLLIGVRVLPRPRAGMGSRHRSLHHACAYARLETALVVPVPALALLDAEEHDVAVGGAGWLSEAMAGRHLFGAAPAQEATRPEYAT